MQKENLKNAIEPSRIVPLNICYSKTNGRLIVRVKKDNLTKRYMNRLFNRKSDLIPEFCKKLGIETKEGEFLVPFSQIAEAAEVFPPVEKWSA